jgi:hypothetical protein
MKKYVHCTRPQAQKEKWENYRRLLIKDFILSTNCDLSLKVTACNSPTKEPLQWEKEREASSKMISL